MTGSSKKRIFMGLLTVSVVFLAGCATFFVFFAFNPVNSFFQTVILLIGLGIAFVLIFAGLGVLLIAISIWGQKPLGALGRLFLRGALKLYPMSLTIGKIFTINAEEIQASFVEVNNHLVRSYHLQLQGKDIMLLAPHCLQKTDCTAKVTQDIDNCRSCGRCDIAGILKLKNTMDINAVVITGGTLARKFIKEFKPKAIVAIACERDLSSGIMDVGPLPVLGVKNHRPYGPCKNTCVDLEKIMEAINFFCKKEDTKYIKKDNDSSAAQAL
ncbi:MAG: DUF116 domain-containing protein [Bacillota bacterium]|jgi:hypothetical protein